MNVISAVKPHACHSCDKSFGRRYNLRRHIESVNTDEEGERDSDIEYLDEPRSKKSRFYSETEDPETEPEENEDDLNTRPNLRDCSTKTKKNEVHN